MDLELVFTVKDALQRPLFEDAHVVAGENGLHRQIRWVHILEIANFETLIHGEEMILTTGVGFNLATLSSVTFTESLIKHNASCLCIEIGPYFDKIPEQLLELCNLCNFPLIVFPQPVRFVDITLDLHSIIINRHHRMLQELESISRAFHRLTLTSQGTWKVLQLLHQSTHAQIIYQPNQGKTLFYPPTLSIQEQKPLIEWIRTMQLELEDLKPDEAPYLREYNDNTVVIKPVGALDQTWAYIMVICHYKPQEYDYMLLDSASISIAQELLRTRYMEERKLFSENVWVNELLNLSIKDENQLKVLIGPDFKKLNELSYRVCLIEIENLYDLTWNHSDQDWESITFHLSLILRSIFEKYSLQPLITLKNNRLAVIVLDIPSKLPSKVRLQQALQALQNIQSDERTKDLKLLIGVGKSHTHLKHAYSGYQEAVQALSLYPCYHTTILFFEDLGIFGLLMNLNDGTTLQTFIRNYLGPLIDYDEAKGSELLLTLRIYLDHDGSKQDSARKLFIVRQSLYYRLDQIAELLGKDFMQPENRIAIQVALRAYQLLEPNKMK